MTSDHWAVGKRFRDKKLDESFTVVGFNGLLLLMQYDDGIPWDEASAPEGWQNDDLAPEYRNEEADVETVGDMAGVTSDGIDSERYVPLGCGPTTRQMCDRGDHDIFPLPDELWPSPEVFHENKETEGGRSYNCAARCVKCGLSLKAITTYQSEGLVGRSWCIDCGDIIKNEEVNWESSRHCVDCLPYPDYPIEW